jgi:hypothetical protein
LDENAGFSPCYNWTKISGINTVSLAVMLFKTKMLSVNFKWLLFSKDYLPFNVKTGCTYKFLVSSWNLKISFAVVENKAFFFQCQTGFFLATIIFPFMSKLGVLTNF